MKCSSVPLAARRRRALKKRPFWALNGRPRSHVVLFRKTRMDNGKMARSRKKERLVAESGSQPEREVRCEGAELDCPPCKPARGRGPAKSVAKSISTFKILRPDEVWQPRVGARPGNKNALKHGRYTAERKAHRKKIALIDTFIRDVLRRARRIEFRADEEFRNRASSNPP
jgi:hypothetical protein